MVQEGDSTKSFVLTWQLNQKSVKRKQLLSKAAVKHVSTSRVCSIPVRTTRLLQISRGLL